MLRDRSELSVVPSTVIAVFAYASDARRALNILHEHRFSSSEVEAAFRVPASERKPVEDHDTQGAPSGSLSSEQPHGRFHNQSHKWFGELRQIYHGANTTREPEAQVAPVTTPVVPSRNPETVLNQLRFSNQDAADLNQDLDRGAAVVAVKAGPRNPEAEALLKQLGARILHAAGPESAEPGPVTVTSMPFAAPQPAEPGHIQLFGEVLRVRKERVESAGVQVHKEAVTRMETVQVPVTREELVVDRSGGEHDESENSIRVPLSEERVYIDKDTVLREEYKVGKREVVQNEIINGSVRRERLLIDDANSRDND
jgi:uncharacterized protein (TIGR02271 family)